ncbi:MAG: hypothetical protein R3349_07365, partial [Geminicoccaceae bacterium]|nr:hypothetical protein [Geminicoccaceae bacterium]
DDSLIGVGKLVVRVQRSLRRSAGGLDTDRRSAAGHLARAEGLLGRLERTAGRSDPTIIALRAEAARLSSLLID